MYVQKTVQNSPLFIAPPFLEMGDSFPSVPVDIGLTIFSMNSRGEAVGTKDGAVWYYHPDKGLQMIVSLDRLQDAYTPWTEQFNLLRPWLYDPPDDYYYNKPEFHLSSLTIGESGNVVGSVFVHQSPRYWIDNDKWEIILDGPDYSGCNYFWWDEESGFHSSPLDIREGSHNYQVSFDDRDQIHIEFDNRSVQSMEEFVSLKTLSEMVYKKVFPWVVDTLIPYHHLTRLILVEHDINRPPRFYVNSFQQKEGGGYEGTGTFLFTANSSQRALIRFHLPIRFQIQEDQVSSIEVLSVNGPWAGPLSVPKIPILTSPKKTEISVSKKRLVGSEPTQSSKSGQRRLRSETQSQRLSENGDGYDDFARRLQDLLLRVKNSKNPIDFLPEFLDSMQIFQVDANSDCSLSKWNAEILALMAILKITAEKKDGIQDMFAAMTHGSPIAWMYIQCHPELFLDYKIPDFEEKYDGWEWNSLPEFFKLMSENRFDEALSLPYSLDDLPAHFFRAMAFEKMGSHQKASEHLRALLALTSNWQVKPFDWYSMDRHSFLIATQKMAYCCLLSGMPAEDVDSPFLEAARLQVEGSIFYEQKQYAECIQALEKSLLLQKQISGLEISEYSVHCLTQSYFHLGLIPESAKSLVQIQDLGIIRSIAYLFSDKNKAIDLLHREDDDHRMAALLLSVLGEKPFLQPPQIAGEDEHHFCAGNYEAVINLPNHRCSSEYRAAALALQGNYETALETYTPLIHATGSEDLYMERAMVYLLKGDEESALSDLKKAESIEMPYYLSREDLLFLPKSTFLLKWIEQKEPLSSTRIQQAETLYNQRDYMAVIDLLEPLVTQQTPVQKYQRGACVDLVGRSYFALGNIEKAAQYFSSYPESSLLQKICSLFPGHFEPIEIDFNDIFLMGSLLKALNQGERCIARPELQGIETLFFNGDYKTFNQIANSLWKGPVFEGRHYLHDWMWLANAFETKKNSHYIEGNVWREMEDSIFEFSMGNKTNALARLSKIEEKERAQYSGWGKIPLVPFIAWLLQTETRC